MTKPLYKFRGFSQHTSLQQSVKWRYVFKTVVILQDSTVQKRSSVAKRNPADAPDAVKVIEVIGPFHDS